MIIYLNRGEYITLNNPLYKGRTIRFKNPDWKGMPEIISFTDYLKWNYTSDYGYFIRTLHNNGQLPLPWDIYPSSSIDNVKIVDGKYAKKSDESFDMYIICEVTFVQNRYYYTYQYLVQGYCNIRSDSNFLYDIDIYDGKYIRLDQPLDEYLIPVLSKSDYSDIAKSILNNYYSGYHDISYTIDGKFIAEAMGYQIQYVRLSLNGKIKSKLIFNEKYVTVYDKNDNPIEMFIPSDTILIDISIMDNANNEIIHECIHGKLHRLFYYLQSHYRKISRVEIPEFNDYFYTDKQKECVHWMEIQANSIARDVQLPEDKVSDVVINYIDKCGEIIEFEDYRGLIDLISWKYSVTRYAAKKRMIELGWIELRGIYEYGTVRYVEDYYVPYNFPMNSTYTIRLKSITKLYAESEDFRALLHSKKYIFVDGHICRNTDQYVVTASNVPIGLTMYARYHMDECCIPFKKEYRKLEYSYTFGELNKEALSAITDEHLSEEQKKKLKLYACEGFAEKNELEKKKTNSPLAEAINFHIKRCDLTSEAVMERSGLGSTTISNLRNGIGTPKLETILAFCQALELEEHFRADLMKKARVEFDTTKDSHNMYLMILDLFPKANVFQINNFLIEQDFKPWTREKKGKNKTAV